MHYLEVTPAEVEICVAEHGHELSAPVCIKNLDARPRSLRVKPPATRWFTVRGIGHTHRLAPGLALNFEVVFHGEQLANWNGQEFHDTIKICSETELGEHEPALEVWVHACPARAVLQLQGDLQFGVVALQTTATKQLQLINTGPVLGQFTLNWNKSLPLTLEPCSGALSPAGTAGCCATITARLAPVDAGSMVGEVSITVAGRQEPLMCPVGASAVPTSYELRDSSSKAPVAEVDFGDLFFGERASRHITLCNNGPTEAHFDLSYGSVSDMKALLGEDDQAVGPAGDTLAAFLQIARIRAKARQDKGSVLRVAPLTGVIPPYSSIPLRITFRPVAPEAAKGFASQPLTPAQQAQPFDGLVQVNLAGGSVHLRLAVRGNGVAPLLKASPSMLHFGIMPTYQWADQLVELTNCCEQLPMQLSVAACGPFFRAMPPELELSPGGTSEVVLRYLPKALGHHQASLCFQVVSRRSPDQVMFEAVVQVQGSSLSLGPKQPLPGGVTATPETFTLPKAFIEEADAAVALLTAKKTFKRPQLWEVAENADRLQGIGARDRFGVTLEVHQARAQHADQYTTFIRAQRRADSRKYLTQPEGDDTDIDMGMKPYRGLHPFSLKLKSQVDPLWTVTQHMQSAPAVQKLPPAAALAAMPTFKEWPQTAQERSACSIELSSTQLSSIMVAPRQLDFGKLSPALPGQQCFLVTNPLSSPIHVVLDVSAVEGLSCMGPCSQVVPAGASAKFPLQLRCLDVQSLKEQVQYLVNGCHWQPLDVSAEIVPVTLDVSDEEMMFSFSLENWDDHVEQALTLDNLHSFEVEYEWSISSPVFSVSPAFGTIKPRCSCQVSVKWVPGAAATQKGPAADHKAPSSEKPDAAKATQGPGVPRRPSSAAGGTVGPSSAAAAVARPSSKASASKGTEAAAISSRSSNNQAASVVGSSITVELPPGPGATSAAAAPASAAAGCQHTGFMTLKLKGGGDAAPKKVMLYGELPASMLKFADKELNLGAVPLHERQTVMVHLKNTGGTAAAFRVSPNNILQVSPERGCVSAESSAELEVQLLLTEPGPVSTVLELDVRGGHALKLPIRAEGVLPAVHLAEVALQFPDTFIGTSSQLPMTLVNTSPVAATLMCDLMQLHDFELHISREAWARAGYGACPVKRIGANGEMSAVGSTRGSRRMTSHGGARTSANNGSSGYKFLICMQPSSNLTLQLLYRPSSILKQQFALPLKLHYSSSDGRGSNSGEGLSAAGSAPAKVSAAGAVSLQNVHKGAAATAAAGRRTTSERRTSTSNNGGRSSKPGSAAGGSKAAAAAGVPLLPSLAVPVSAEGVVPRLILSKTMVDFGSRIARRAMQGGKSPHIQELHIRNNTDAPIQVALGAPATLPQPVSSNPNSHRSNKSNSKQADNSKAASAFISAFTLEGWDTKPSAAFVNLDPEEELSFIVRFSPTEARTYEAAVPVFADGNKSVPYMQLRLAGIGMLPRLTFDVAECMLGMVPLNVTSRARIFIINGGYDNLELSVRLPPDTSRLPLSVTFPEGSLIGLAKERLPVDISCCSSKPLSFTAMVDFMDEDGRAFSIPVTGATDSCSLSHQPFLQLNASRLLVHAGEGPMAPPRLADSGYEMLLDEVVGPLHLSEGVCKYLSAVTSGSWSTKAHTAAASDAAADGGDSAATGSGTHAAAALRQWLVSSRGKGLLELIEALGGKAVSLKGAGSSKQQPGSAASKADAVFQLLGVYEAAISHLRSHGALLNAVKPEYLLPESEFQHLMEARGATAAGNEDMEEALEIWAPVELGFGAYSAMAWNSILLQMLKVYVLARVTPAALQQLLTSMDLGASGLSKCASALDAASSPTAFPKKEPSTRDMSIVGGAAARALSSAASLSAAKSVSSVADAAATDVAVPGQLPPDEVLSSSNIYSTAEACLLTWMTVHITRVFPKLALQVTNFSTDMRDGRVLGALLAEYWPGDASSQLLARLHQRPTTTRHVRENQEMVARAVQELCLPYDVSASDLDEAEPHAMLLLITYFFTALPQLLPRATLEFNCKLAEQQVREIQLTNPTRRPLSYSARLEGPADFSLDTSMVKIDPGRSTQVTVNFKPSTSLPKSCRLILMSRRENSTASAATLVFLLKGQADGRTPLKQVAISAPQYQLVQQDFTITNPFPTDCDFSISLIPILEQPSKGNASSKKGSTSAASTKDNSPGGKTAASLSRAMSRVGGDQAAPQPFPEPFGLDRHRLRLKAGASEKIKLSFLPFKTPATPAASSSSPAGAKKPGARAGKGAAAAEPAKPSVRSLLVLKDADCGEFAYELCGEVLPPAVFLQHAAKVSAEGQQAVELQLPFSNHLLESARRTYAEKHPLGKDKEQAGRLHSASGSSNDRGERSIDYTVSCNSPFFIAPPTVTLKAGAPTPTPHAAAAAGATGSPRPSGIGSNAGKLQPPPAAKRNANDSVIKLAMKPVGPGVYPAKLTLTSAIDVRVVELQVTAQASGQSCTLELECPARQQVVQELPLQNASSDAPLSVTATLTGKGFSGPRDVSIPAKTNGSYLLTFSPPGNGSYTGTLELLLNSTGEKLLFNLAGRGSEPFSEGHVVIDCQARSSAERRVQVPNIIGSLPLQYSVLADADWMSGPAVLDCASSSRGDTYKLSVRPLTSGIHWGSVSFVAPDGQYCWYSVEVRASEPPQQGSVTASCSVHQALAIKVALTNPLEKPLRLKAVYGCPSLVGPSVFVAPAGPGAEAVFECYYAPLLVGSEEGVLRLISKEAGEFWWKFALEATPALPEPPIHLAAPIGTTVSHVINIANPTAAEAVFACSSDSPDRFWLAPANVKVAPGGVGEVQLHYRPGSVGHEEQGLVKVVSQTAGSFEHQCFGKGEVPTGVQSSSASAALGTSATSNLTFSNPFGHPVTVEVVLSSAEPPGTFSIQLPEAKQLVAAGGRQQQALQRQKKHAPPAWAGLSDADAPLDSEADPDSECEEESGDCEDAGAAGAFGNAAAAALFGVQQQLLQQQQQQLPRQPAAQQSAQVVVAAGATLQLPVSYCPRVLREAAAQLSVKVLPPAAPATTAADAATQAAAAAHTAEPVGPLVWQYEVKGAARSDAPGVKFAVKCVAKQKVEQVLEVPLPGLDLDMVAALARQAAAAKHAGAGVTASTGTVDGFGYELVLPEATGRASLATALSLSQLDQLPTRSRATAGSATSSPRQGMESVPVMRFMLHFAPQKPVNTVVQLAVKCGGACWMYDINVLASAPDIAGVLTLEAHMGCTAELPLFMYASGPEPEPFTAEFTPESPLNFDVLPAKGMLPPAPPDGAGELQGGAGKAREAPMKVTFLCKEFGKVMSGKLVVVTPDRHETFLVKGRQPVYIPPNQSKLPSGTYMRSSKAASSLTRGAHQPNKTGPTAAAASSSSQSSISSNRATQRQLSALSARQEAAAGAVEQQTAGKPINHLQQNIKLAAATRTAAAKHGSQDTSHPWA